MNFLTESSQASLSYFRGFRTGLYHLVAIEMCVLDSAIVSSVVISRYSSSYFRAVFCTFVVKLSHNRQCRPGGV